MSFKPDPLVSVLMPVFNAEHFIARSLNSLITQSYQNIEIIVIDDGSTDRTYSLLESIKSTDSRIKLFRQSNQGLTKSLNTAASYASGDLFARHDADDVSLPDRIRLQVNEFRMKSIDFCCSRTYFYPKSKPSPHLRFYIPRGFSLLFENVFIHGTFMLTRQVFYNLNGYSEEFQFAQDYDFITRFLAAGYSYSYLAQPLYLSYSPASAISQSKRVYQQQLARHIKLKWLAQCMQNPLLILR